MPATGIDDLKFDNPHDASSVMEQLQGMMAASKMKLSMAQAHHTKVVNKARKKTLKFLSSEAESLGDAIGRYGLELRKAESELQLALETAKADLKKAADAPSDPSDWRDPLSGQKATLAAQVGSAERALKKAQRKRTRSVREAEDRVEEPLDDQAQKLAMKIGDLTPDVDKAKQTLEAHVDSVMANASSGIVRASLVDATDKKSSGKASDYLVKDVALLQAAVKQIKGAVDAADKRFNAVVENAAKEVAAQGDNVTAYLQRAQEREIARVLGRPVAPKKTSKNAIALKANDMGSKKNVVDKTAKHEMSSKAMPTAAKHEVMSKAAKQPVVGKAAKHELPSKAAKKM